MSDTKPPWSLSLSNDKFEIKALEVENDILRRRYHALRVENAELRAELAKRRNKKESR